MLPTPDVRAQRPKRRRRCRDIDEDQVGVPAAHDVTVKLVGQLRLLKPT